MQFVPNGPDVPEELLRAHTEGRVVFFCGAGISLRSNLPTFKSLVQKIYREVATPKSPVEQSCFKAKEYDRVLDLLERRIVGDKNVVRKSVEKILTIQDKAETQTHKALLTLGRDNYGQGQLRLVTTNYDQLFHIASKETIEFKEYVAPCLPIPKKSRWDGLVFLHGLLPNEQGSEIELNRLVLTSGDFGLAYLTERWASRFVTELFRNFVVCFVGYSINDPVLRYMMDALSADRTLGENVEKVWVFAKIETKANEESARKMWEAKGVTPILSKTYALLHSTLQEWARAYSDGLEGKRKIIQSLASIKPYTSTVEDHCDQKMLWAISDPSGQTARYFATLEDNPPLEWFLDVFVKEILSAKQLVNYGLLSNEDVSTIKGNFSLVKRIPSTQYAIPMSLGSMSCRHNNIDDVMWQIMQWLCRHLNDPRLLLWLVQNVGTLNPCFCDLIENRMIDSLSYENEDKVDKLEPSMERLWNLYLNGFIRTNDNVFDQYLLENWQIEYSKFGLTSSLRRRFRAAFSPMVNIRAKSSSLLDASCQKEKSVNDFVSYDLVLNVNDAFDFLTDLKDKPLWQKILPELFDDFEQLLKEALKLFQDLGVDVNNTDPASLFIYSLDDEFIDYFDWVLLVELLKDSWLKINENNPERSAMLARVWMHSPYLTFQRLGI